MKNIDLTIYEKNEGVGGTWFVSRYPVNIKPLASALNNIVNSGYLFAGMCMRRPRALVPTVI